MHTAIAKEESIAAAAASSSLLFAQAPCLCSLQMTDLFLTCLGAREAAAEGYQQIYVSIYSPTSL